MKKSQSAFTLIELMIVVVLLGIVVVFGIPSYNKSRARAVEKDGVHNLSAIALSMEMYKVRDDGGEYPRGSVLGDVGEINTTLDLGIIEQRMVYSCKGTGNNFDCTADPDDYKWKIEVSNTDSGNPNCKPGPACPTL